MKIGKFTFRQSSTLSMISRRIERSASERLTMDKIIWYMNQSTKINWSDIFEYIEICSITNLVIAEFICTQKMFLTLIIIKFDCLTILNIINSSVCSIESLAFLDAPLIERIMLRKPNLTNCSNALSKSMFPYLKRIV